MAATTTDHIAYSLYRKFRPWVPYRHLWIRTLVWQSADVPTAEIRRAVEQYARKCKATKCGYRVDDEQFYSRRTIELLLPYALAPDAIPPPTVADEASINQVHAGKEGYGGWESAVADIRAGLKGVSEYQRNLLVLRYAGGHTPTWLAQQLGVTPDAIWSSCGRAVRTIQRRLGGRKP